VSPRGQGGSRGHDRERELVKQLGGEGWLAFRAPASLGVADVVAMRRVDVPPGLASEVRLFEVKSTAGGPWERFGPSSRALLSAAAARAGATAWLAYKPPRGSWLFVPEEQWPVWRAAA
jgi:Holliday junction resolvase